MSNKLKAGVSIIDISPEKGVELAGYPHCPRLNTGVHDPLHASCIFLDNGQTKLVIVAMDLLMYSKKYVRSLRKQISDKTGILPGNILICCSHTHSAPWTSGRLDLEALEKGLATDDAYVSWLESRLVSMVVEACSSPFDAQIGVSKGICGGEQGVGGNRRDPGGAADKEVCVIGVKDTNGIWRGCLVCYALHPTVLHSDNTLVSADYPAYIRKHLKWAKPGMITLFSQGTSGNQSTRYFRDGQNYEEACRIGTTIGVEAARVLDSMDLTEETGLLIQSIETDLPLREYIDKETAVNNVKEAEEKLALLRASNGSYIDIRNAELKLLGAEDILGYIILQEKGIKPSLLTDELPYEIQVIGIGNARIVCLQGEAFVEIGLEIKKRSPFAETFVISLSNGVAPGYVYTAEALDFGGYETDTSMLGPGSAKTIVEKAVKLLNEKRMD